MEEKINIRKLLIISFGVLIVVLGMYFFLIPTNLAVGGVTGLGIVINHIFPKVHLGAIMIVLNIILFIVAFVLIGPEFGGYTVYSSFAISGLIYILEILIPLHGPLVDDLMLNLIFGILIQGVGMALVFNQGTSTGGTDIVAKVINKFFHLEIGKSLFLADFLIVLSAIYVFGIELGLYALLGIVINSAVIDNLITGFNTKIKVTIISKKEKQICKYITEKLDRGVTLFYGSGGFSNKDMRIINTVVSRREYIRIKDYVKEIDPQAFIWVNIVHEVLGEGFSK